jgi:hypothetical protein
MNVKPIILSAVIALSTFLYGCIGSDDDSSETIASSGLVINEIVASASDGGNDWIELYATEDAIDLSNYTIVDDNDGRESQALPDVTLALGEFIVIQAIDEEDTPPESGYYVTFKLGSDDAVTLYENDVQVSQLDWEEGEAEEGFSFGLYEDGTGEAQTLTPTQGSANQTTDEIIVVVTTLIDEDSPLRINEVVAKSTDNNGTTG